MLTVYPLTGTFHELSLDLHHFTPFHNTAFIIFLVLTISSVSGAYISADV